MSNETCNASPADAAYKKKDDQQAKQAQPVVLGKLEALVAKAKALKTRRESDASYADGWDGGYSDSSD